MFCELLRVALGLSQVFPYIPTPKEWQSLYTMAHSQTVLGVAYNAIANLPKESQPPRLLKMLWARDAEAIRGKNRLFNQESARYTQQFAEHGFQSAILKGQANARLYPDPFSRQPGDIDIWVAGGYYKVLELLQSLGIQNLKDLRPDYHDIGFQNENGIEVEVHHKPSSVLRSNKNDIFQKILLKEIEDLTLTPEGFYTPSIRFALIMQFAHLHKHSLESGIGIRQYMDYFILLSHSTEADRKFAWDCIKKFGQHRAGPAIMGVLELIFGLSRDKMLCKPKKTQGKVLYDYAMAEGNFGFYKKEANCSVLRRWFNDRIHEIRKFPIDLPYMLKKELRYWKWTLKRTPERIRLRRLSLR